MTLIRVFEIYDVTKAPKATKDTYSQETRHINSKTRRPGSQGKEFTTSKIAPEANEN
jgi:hypothetical protein